jgi:hypothetical protein
MGRLGRAGAAGRRNAACHPDGERPDDAGDRTHHHGLGTLPPILREDALLDAPFGRWPLVAGAIGEVAPIVAVSLLLSSIAARGRNSGC